jgi:sugar phosphate isomerase/epimerase
MSTHELSRRAFLALAGGAPFAASLLAQGKKVPVGIELYSVRGELTKDLTATVTAVARMGYEVVEFYSPYYSWTPEAAKDVRKLLDDLGIKCLSTHNGPQSISADGLAKAIDLNHIIGSRNIIIASAGKVVDVDGWKAFAASLTAAQEKLRPQGMATGFHNHQTEWRPIGDTRPMDVIAGGTPKDVVLQLDCGTSVEAGVDPVAWITANPGRIKSLHLKDWSKAAGYRVAFGEGDVPWKGIFAAAESTGGVEYYLIEQEIAGADGEFAMAKKCLDNYKKMRV